MFRVQNMKKTTTLRVPVELHVSLKKCADQTNQKFGRMIENILRAWLSSGRATKAKRKTI